MTAPARLVEMTALDRLVEMAVPDRLGQIASPDRLVPLPFQFCNLRLKRTNRTLFRRQRSNPLWSTPTSLPQFHKHTHTHTLNFFYVKVT